MFVDNSSVAEVGTSRASMNRTSKSNATKGVHNHYNEYKEFHQREIEGHICTSFMVILGMTKPDGKIKNAINLHPLIPFQSLFCKVTCLNPLI